MTALLLPPRLVKRPQLRRLPPIAPIEIPSSKYWGLILFKNPYGSWADRLSTFSWLVDPAQKKWHLTAVQVSDRELLLLRDLGKP